MLIWSKFYCLLTLVSKVTGEDGAFHDSDIWKCANIHVRLLCYLSCEINKHHCLYPKHLCDFGEGYTQCERFARRITNTLQSVSFSFFELPLKLNSCSGTCFKEQACLSKASSVNKQNKRDDDGWLLKPTSDFSKCCSCSKWVVLHWFVSRQRKNNLGASTS